MEKRRSPLVSIPPLRGGDFQGIGGLSSDDFSLAGKRESLSPRAARHRLDEPTRLSLGMVASLQSPPPFHLVTVIVASDTVALTFPFGYSVRALKRAAQTSGG